MWIAFVLNELPIQTPQNGSFNCICLMDAASCFILASEMITTNQAEPSEIEARRLFKVAQVHNTIKPVKLLVPAGQFSNYLAAEAKRRGMELIQVRSKASWSLSVKRSKASRTTSKGLPGSET